MSDPPTFFSGLDAAVWWDVALFQEWRGTPGEPREEAISGHDVCSAPAEGSRGSGIASNSHLNCSSSDSAVYGSSNRIVLKRSVISSKPFNCMTLYLPQPALSDQEYLDVLDDASRLLELFVPPGEPIVISVDGNCRLGQPASDLEWRYLGDALRQVRNQRGQFLLNFIIKHDLLVADSFFPHGSLPTRHGWTASSYEDEAEHMDFFLVTRDVIIKNYLIKKCDATITDHSMLMLTIEFRRRFKKWHAPKPIGWQCADASLFFQSM